MAVKASVKIPVNNIGKSDPISSWIYLAFGAVFGYLLVKARITESDSILNMFLFKEAFLYKVIGLAVAVTALGIFLIDHFSVKAVLGAKPIEWEPVEFKWDRVAGAALFGAGWALTGACPASAMAQLGEGKLAAIFTVAGILVGTWAYRLWSDESEA